MNYCKFSFLCLILNNVKCADGEKIKLDNNVTIYVYDDNITYNTYWTKNGFTCNKKITPSDFYDLKNFTENSANKLKINELDDSYKIYKIQIENDGKYIDYEKDEFEDVKKYWIYFVKPVKLPNESEIEIDNIKLNLNDCCFNFYNCTDEKDFLKCIYNLNKDKIKFADFSKNYGILEYYSYNTNKNENCIYYCSSDIIKELVENIKNNKPIKIKIVKLFDYKISDIKLSNDLEKIYKFISNEEKNKIINNINNNSRLKGYRIKYKKKEILEKCKNIFTDIEDYEDKNNETEIDNTPFDFIITKFKENSTIIVPKKCTIKFEAGNNLFITDSTKYQSSKIIDFSNSEGGITTDTVINDYITNEYSKIKDKCTITKTNDNSGKFKDGTIVTVTINQEIEGITTKKDSNKVYIKVQFKVSDTNKFKFKGSLVNTNEFNLEFEKNKKITDLLAEIKKKLGNEDLKNGYKIELDNTNIDNNTELVDNANYIITLADDDTNFVEEIKDEHKDDDTEEHKNDDTEEHDNNNNNNNNNNNGVMQEKNGCYTKNNKRKYSNKEK